MEQAVRHPEAPVVNEMASFFASPRRRPEGTLFYDPPYENDLDDALARHLIAYLVPAASLEYKAAVWAAFTECRFDFLIDLGTRRIALDYTDTPENLETALVEDNDALAIGAEVVDVVFRVRQRDLEQRLYDGLHLIARWEPRLFTPYGQRVFARRASEEAREVLPEPEAGLASIYYAPSVDENGRLIETISGEAFEWPVDDDEDDAVVVRRLTREQPDYWRRQYERASLVYGRGPIRRVQRI